MVPRTTYGVGTGGEVLGAGVGGVGRAAGILKINLNSELFGWRLDFLHELPISAIWLRIDMSCDYS